MRKLILVCAIISINQLYAMEPEQKPIFGNSLTSLPRELIVAIIQNSNNADEAIYVLKALSVTNKELNKIFNLQNKENFWKLVELLANNYPDTVVPVDTHKEIDIKHAGLNMKHRIMVTIAQKLHKKMSEDLPDTLLFDAIHGAGVSDFDKGYIHPPSDEG